MEHALLAEVRTALLQRKLGALVSSGTLDHTSSGITEQSFLADVWGTFSLASVWSTLFERKFEHSSLATFWSPRLCRDSGAFSLHGSLKHTFSGGSPERSFVADVWSTLLVWRSGPLFTSGTQGRASSAEVWSNLLYQKSGAFFSSGSPEHSFAAEPWSTRC